MTGKPNLAVWAHRHARALAALVNEKIERRVTQLVRSTELRNSGKKLKRQALASPGENR